MQEKEWLAPSINDLFPDEEAAARKRQEEQQRLADDAYFADLARKRDEDNRLRIAQQQREAEAQRIADYKANHPTPLQRIGKALRRIGIFLVAILATLASIIFFVPLCILGLFGMSKHPFLSYFLFRDYLRHH